MWAVSAHSDCHWSRKNQLMHREGESALDNSRSCFQMQKCHCLSVTAPATLRKWRCSTVEGRVMSACFYRDESLPPVDSNCGHKGCSTQQNIRCPKRKMSMWSLRGEDLGGGDWGGVQETLSLHATSWEQGAWRTRGDMESKRRRGGLEGPTQWEHLGGTAVCGEEDVGWMLTGNGDAEGAGSGRGGTAHAVPGGNGCGKPSEQCSAGPRLARTWGWRGWRGRRRHLGFGFWYFLLSFCHFDFVMMYALTWTPSNSIDYWDKAPRVCFVINLIWNE